MDLFLNFVNEYGTMILYAIIVAVGSWLGTQIKGIYERYVTDKQTKAVVETVVKAVEQLYHDMDGEEKYMKALDAAHEMLAAKGLTVSTLELQMLIEAAVSSFNYGFGGKKTYGEFEAKEGVMADGTEAETGAQE